MCFCFFFALNSASTNEDFGRPCASPYFALNQKKIMLNSLENVEEAHSHSDPFCNITSTITGTSTIIIVTIIMTITPMVNWWDSCVQGFGFEFINLWGPCVRTNVGQVFHSGGRTKSKSFFNKNRGWL